MKDDKEYKKAYYQAHKDSEKAKMKAYYQANKEKYKAYYQAHKEDKKAYYKENKEQINAYKKAYKKAYTKNEVNLLGQTKANIRQKSRIILKKSGIKIHGYQIHHCFGYEDPSKFIYISKSLHMKIHQFLRDNNIDADTDHWMQIRDIVNSADEFVYIKC